MYFGVFSPGPVNSEEAGVVDRIVAVVNEDIVTLAELNRVSAPYIKRLRAAGFPAEKEKKETYKIQDKALDKLIDQKLEEQEIKETGITVSDPEIDGAIENIKKNNSVTDEDLRKMLAREGMTMTEYREQIRKQILKSKLINSQVRSKIIITEEDIRIYYEAHKEEFSEESQYHLRNIIMRVPEYSAPKEKDHIKARMEIVLEKLKQGEPFEKLAREHSQSPLAEKGGDLGLIDANILSELIQTALKGLNAGQFTDVLDTEQGFQIFYVEKVLEARMPPLEEVSPKIQGTLYNQMLDEAHQSWFSEIKKKSSIIKKL
jgi:peptidyl-prolyl cis-trans isomerase SurA